MCFLLVIRIKFKGASSKKMAIQNRIDDLTKWCRNSRLQVACKNKLFTLSNIG